MGWLCLSARIRTLFLGQRITASVFGILTHLITTAMSQAVQFRTE